MYKKVIQLLMCICIVSNLTNVVAATNPVVFLSNHNAYAGEFVEMQLVLSGCNGFADLGLEIGYDSRYLELVEVKNNPDIRITCTTAQYINSNPYNIGWGSSYNTYFNGTLATLRFLVRENTPVGEYKVTVDYYKGRNGDYIDGDSVNYDQDYNPLTLSYQDGCITVCDLPIDEDIAISFDKEYVKSGDNITASIDGFVDSDECLMFLVGYSEQGQATFIKMGSDSATATVTDDTVRIKAMLWDKKLAPMVDAATLNVSK